MGMEAPFPLWSLSLSYSTYQVTRQGLPLGGLLQTWEGSLEDHGLQRAFSSRKCQEGLRGGQGLCLGLPVPGS